MENLNKKLAKIFAEMAAIYDFLNGRNRFRVIAYEKAALFLENLDEDLTTYSEKELEGLRGIGHGIATKIEEYIATGKIEKYEELKASVPAELISLSGLKGFGPKTLKSIYDNLGIRTKKELVLALKDGRIEELRGFGGKKVEAMLKGLEMKGELEERISLWEAQRIGEELVNYLKEVPGIDKIEIAGSVRRCKEDIGDLDILATCTKHYRKQLLDHFISYEDIQEVLAKGQTKASVVIKDHGRQVDLRLMDPAEWGAAMVYFTGSKQHNVHIRSIAKEKGLKISEYGVFKSDTGKKIAGKTEEEVYKTLKMQWIPPEIREDRGEVELSLEAKVPKLIQISDLKGDLQMHSTWTDGMHSIEEVANFVRKNYPYKYIAMTDHTKAVRIAGGMQDKEFFDQIKEIKEINNKLGEDFIKAGAEVDINPDGSLDLADEILEQLDWVVASIHTQFNRDNTDRLIKACENPYVHVIGHPTGRLLGSREAYKLNMEELLQTAKSTGTALEINAQPQRMDLNDRLAFMARERGVKMIISTDSHTFGNFNFMKLGVNIARRAWCTKEDILNTRSWKDLNSFFQKKRKKLV